ncbi:MAG: cobalamin-binding protein [Firmicutes bacterium]|nr:cobalamin-binding protein [Bacillota bacterium]
MSGSRMSSWFRLLKMSKSPVSSWLRRSAAAILFVAVLAAAAGSVYAAGGYPVSIVDDTGMTIEIPREPVRIVSLAPSNTEILFALGLGDKVVGVTSACDYPEAAKKVDKVGDYNINIEAVVAKRPDLVVAVADLQMPVVQKLRELKLRVVAVNPRTLEEVFHAVEVIGDACGAGDAGRRMVDGLRARVAAVESKAATIPADSRPRVFVEIWNDPLMTAGAGTFVDDLVRRAGGRNVVGHIEGWPQISPETVLSAHTDFIILTCFNRAEVMARHEWRKVPAVVQGRVFEIHPDLMVRPGPRLVDGLEALARLFVSGQ